MATKSQHPSLLRGLLVGAAAGFTATLIMDQFQKLSATGQKAVEKHRKLAEGESPWQVAHEQAWQEQQEASQEGSTEIVARNLAGAAGKEIPPDVRKQAGQAVHYTFGTLMGIVYGLTAEHLPAIASGGGAAFGTLLFLGADEVAVPALRLSPPPTETAPTDHLQHWAAHIVYGGALELTRSLLRSFL